MAPPKKNSAVVSIKAKKTISLPPMTLGFASLVDPDTYEPDKPLFKLNGHLTPESLEALKETILEKVYTEAMVAKLYADACESGLIALVDSKDPSKGYKPMKPMQAPDEWLEGKLKEPKEAAKIQLPHITLSSPATYKDRKTGEVVQKTLGCWDGSGKILNLKGMKLGMGSIIQPVVWPNLFLSKLIGVPQPSLKLVGVKVLKLERWGGGAAPPETDEEAIKEVLGEAFKYEDLSQYMGSGAEVAHDDEDQEGRSPEELAKDMF